ncbi:hypothetical protein BC831DRAFT_481951 [Entophlyctis helioformis]|nr:hypothetical protein BC831DRAFT_481951 [Entophlyctis helioformis]
MNSLPVQRVRDEYLRRGGSDISVLAELASMEREATLFKYGKQPALGSADLDRQAALDVTGNTTDSIQGQPYGHQEQQYGHGLQDEKTGRGQQQVQPSRSAAVPPPAKSSQRTTATSNRVERAVALQAGRRRTVLERLQQQHKLRMLKLQQEREVLIMEQDLRELREDLGLPQISHAEIVSGASSLAPAVTDASNAIQAAPSAEADTTLSESAAVPLGTQAAASSYRGAFYDPVRGVCLYWDYLIAMQTNVKWTHSQTTFTVFNGAQSAQPVQIVPFQPCAPITLSSGTSAACTIMRSQHSIVGSYPTAGYATPLNRLVVEVRIKDETSPIARARLNPVCLGWTSFDLFSNRLQVEAGTCTAVSTPIDFNITTASLYTTTTPLPNTCLLLRICDVAYIASMLEENPDPVSAEQLYSTKTYTSSQQAHFPNSDVSKPSLTNINRIPASPSPIGVIRPLQDHLQQFLKPVTLESIKRKFGPSESEMQRAAVAAANAKAVAAHMALISKAKTFEFGMPEVVSVRALIVKMRVVDPQGEPPTPTGFTSLPAEVQLVSSRARTAGERGDVHEFVAVPALDKRKAVFDLMDEQGQQVATGSIEIFKFHQGEPFGINDGLHEVALTLAQRRKDISSKSVQDNPLDVQPTLVLRVYNPKYGTPPSKRFSPRLVVPPIPAEAWIAVPLSKGEPYKGESITVVIEGARFLPENVTTTRVFAKLYTNRFKPIPKFPEMSTGFNLDSPIYSPTFNVKQTLDGGNIDPTAVLVFKVYSIDNYAVRRRLVGSAALNLFNDATTMTQPESRATADTSLVNAGAFQIPIYSVDFDKAAPLRVNKLGSTPRVPCATLLIRLVFSKSKDPPVPPLPYSSETYQSIPYSQPTGYEEKLYPFVIAERPPHTTRDRMLSFKGISKSATQGDDALLQWLEKVLEITTTDPLPLMSTNYIVKYDPLYGFSLSVDSATNLTTKGFAVAVVGLYPPAGMYRDETEGDNEDDDEDGGDGKPKPMKAYDDVMYTKAIDFASPARHPVWLDGFHRYRYRPMGNMAAIIHVFVMVQQGNGWQPSSQGWTYLPIFENGAINMGNFRLPLYEGDPPEALFDEWDGDADFDESVAEAVASKTIRLSRKASSVVVRLCDARRTDEMPFDVFGAHSDRLGDDVLRYKASGGSPLVSALVPRKMSPDEYVQRMYQGLSAYPPLRPYM